MKIRLSDLPEEGKSYVYNRKTAELNEVLKDLIDDQPYEVTFHLRPFNTKNFELKGLIKTDQLTVCSKCGDDFKFLVNQDFHEILTPSHPVDRTGHYTKTHRPDDDFTSTISNYEYGEDMMFDTAEYFHEMIGLAIPPFPTPPADKNEDCTLCHRSMKTGAFDYREADVEEVKKSPFAILQNLKSN